MPPVAHRADEVDDFYGIFCAHIVTSDVLGGQPDVELARKEGFETYRCFVEYLEHLVQQIGRALDTREHAEKWRGGWCLLWIANGVKIRVEVVGLQIGTMRSLLCKRWRRWLRCIRLFRVLTEWKWEVLQQRACLVMNLYR